MDETTDGQDAGELPDDIFETRAREIVTHLADDSIDELPYFENPHPKLAPSNLQKNWNDMTGIFGPFEGVSGASVAREEVEDRVVGRVEFSLGSFVLKAKIVFDYHGQVTGIWFSRADDPGVLDRVSESARVVRHGVNEAATNIRSSEGDET